MKWKGGNFTGASFELFTEGDDRNRRGEEYVSGGSQNPTQLEDEINIQLGVESKWNIRSFIGNIIIIPESSLESSGPVLLIAHESAFEIILDSFKRHESLFHSFVESIRQTLGVLLLSPKRLKDLSSNPV